LPGYGNVPTKQQFMTWQPTSPAYSSLDLGLQDLAGSSGIVTHAEILLLYALV